MPNMLKGFKRCVTYSNWCCIDKLDGEEFANGEKVYAKWPDGGVTREKIRYVKGTDVVYDMGHNYDAPDYRAFIDVTFRGVKVAVPLRNSKIRLKRIA